MNIIRAAIQKLIAAIVFVVAAIVFLPICMLFACLPASIRYSNRFYFFLIYVWNWLLVKGAFLKLTIVGEQNIPRYPQTPAVIVVNHSSSYDIYVTEFLLGGYPHIWLSKASYANVPFFGFLLRRMGVLVDRKNPFKAAKALMKAVELVKNSARHVVLFPEGTRFIDGKIHPFNSGFALLSKKLHRPTIPIYVYGMHQFLPPGSIFINLQHNKNSVVIGNPMYCNEDESVEQFSLRVHQWFCEQAAEKNQ